MKIKEGNKIAQFGLTKQLGYPLVMRYAMLPITAISKITSNKLAWRPVAPAPIQCFVGVQ